jgi:capsular polysaccharide biosynthesis protein
MTGTISPPQRGDGRARVDLLGVWLRRSWSLGAIAAVAAATVLLCALVALPIGLNQPRVYGAQSDILFDAGPDASDASADRALVTQQVVLRSNAVLGPVAEAERVPVERLEEALSVEVVNQSNILRITVGDRDPDTARRLIQRITDEYGRQMALTGSVEDPREISQLEGRMKDLSASLAKAQADLDVLSRRRAPGQPPSARERELQLAAEATQGRLRSIQERITEVELARTGGARSRVLTSAHVLAEPLRPRPLQALAWGALVGLFVATAIVLLLLRPRFTPDRDLWG